MTTEGAPRDALRILVVEDEAAHAELIHRAFEYQSQAVELAVATTLADARDRLAAAPPDLMLVDMLLPDGKGTDLLPGSPEASRYPIVVMTSHGDEQVAVDALKAGALDYVVKTVETLADMPHIAERTLREWRHIIERKQAEAAHRETEERLQSILDHAPTVVYVRDADGRLLTVNRRYEELFGVRREAAVGRSADDVLPPSIAATFRANEAQVLASGRSLEFEEVIGADGDPRTYLSVKFPLYDANGKVSAVGSFSNDITERKRSEEERDLLEAQLRQSKKLETIGTLAGGIAHDFNNILSPILGFTEMALDELSAETQAHADLQHVIKAAERAKDLVQHILVFSRQAEPRRQLIRVQPIFEEAFNLLRASLPKSIEIQCHIASDCGTVRADSTQLLQLLMNLSTNAYHAMRGQGRGLLELRLDEVPAAAAPQIDLDTPAFVRIAVRDTGHGMDRATLDRIFDPFFTMKGVKEGTGLGLSVVHGIVMSHGGRITVESELGQGTVFEVYLPLAPEEAPLEVAATEPVARGSERVLLVDDEEEVALMIHQMLERLGYRVSMWTSSEEALAAFRTDPQAFDVVLTDQTMPGLTGDRLTEIVLAIRPDLPIVLMTGFSERVTPERSRELGARAYLMKPVVARELSSALRAALDG